ncbi:hypothetical protein STEG23_033934, partial [Scotinomys teguina]
MVTSSMAGWRLLSSRTGVFSSCCLALDSSSSFPCPAFRAIAKSYCLYLKFQFHKAYFAQGSYKNTINLINQEKCHQKCFPHVGHPSSQRQATVWTQEQLDVVLVDPQPAFVSIGRHGTCHQSFKVATEADVFCGADSFLGQKSFLWVLGYSWYVSFSFTEIIIEI